VQLLFPLPHEVKHCFSLRHQGLLKCSNILPAELVPFSLISAATVRKVYQDGGETSHRIPCTSATVRAEEPPALSSPGASVKASFTK
jgi:hypothetical protein